MYAVHNQFEMEQSDWSFQHSGSAKLIVQFHQTLILGPGAARLIMAIQRDVLNSLLLTTVLVMRGTGSEWLHTHTHTQSQCY